MKNFVISLKSAIKRREHINNEFGKHNVNFEFFDALTPDIAEDYAKSLGLNLDTASLTPGELACMMSHVAIWKKAIDEKIPYVTVFEDDVYLGEDAEILLNSAEWIKTDWNIIKIETVLKKIILTYKSYQVATGRREVAQLKSKHLGTGGYIISLRGAILFFEYIHNTNLRPLDELIFEDFITKYNEPVYQMKPALCIQEIILAGPNADLSFPSGLIEERRDRMKSEKKPAMFKVKREINRIGMNIKKSIFASEVLFK